ncbi:30S ribosomal protein S5 alanine N-acetyltransferase [Pseudoalteromonas sp. S1609]|uniref:GNAT family N-acetyltransferase n=1 Tax=Pseudoalteromonas sp. S1609 TaxID=579505 RepID=UPI00110A12A9|nr:GNAT family N-acetyltransferase [Pseudoalteromonas sp. S1609]TMP73461.1 30S ribosomal protein S5 alanine N-acetyltransferase [Pseudoalteromonas sp. S1609]
MIETSRTFIKVLEESEADLLLEYYFENWEHLDKWQPKREQGYFTVQNFRKQLKVAQDEFKAGNSFQFSAICKETSKVVGVSNFTGLARGPFLACFLGYSIAKASEGKGLMKEILNSTIEHMFSVEGLNRVMATYMPANERSGNLLDSLGFEKEGLARKYLRINDKWEDHVLTSKINEELT